MSRPIIPRYRLHKPTGQAVVTLRVAGKRKDHYLGRYGSPESRQRYADLIGRAPDDPSPLLPRDAPDLLTVGELCDRYLVHARRYYVKGGVETSQVDRIETALAAVRDRHNTTPARDFGARSLKEVREQFLTRRTPGGTGYVRRYVNQLVGCVVRCWKWAASEEMVPAECWHALRCVEGLRAGRCGARESPPVEPVSAAVVETTLPHLGRVVAAMVRLQMFTGMRPGEVCVLRPCDVDRTGDVWLYRPASHKTEHHGCRRTVAIGPRGQAVLAPFLLRDPVTYCFSPAEARLEWEAGKRDVRRSPVQPSQANRHKADPQRQPGKRYDTRSYACAVARGGLRAGVARWGPNRLRHLVATEVRREYGLEAAQTVLGHARADITQVYAERDLQRAVDVARRAG